MPKFFNYILKKIIRYKKFVFNATMLICLFFVVLFLYNNLYKTLNEIAEIHSLKSESDFAVLNQKLVDEVIKKIGQKTKEKKKGIVSSPFD